MTTITFTESLTVINCASCHVAFALPESFRKRRLDDHKNFYCPAGHINLYRGKSDAERALESAERLAQQLASREEDLRVERTAHSSTKGLLTKVKKKAAAADKRAAAGVCPCCNRSFQNVRRHVSGQHPTYAGEVLK